MAHREKDIDVNNEIDLLEYDPYDHLPGYAHACYRQLDELETTPAQSTTELDGLCLKQGCEWTESLDTDPDVHATLMALRLYINRFFFRTDTAGPIPTTAVDIAESVSESVANDFRPLGVFFEQDPPNGSLHDSRSDQAGAWIKEWYGDIRDLMISGRELARCPPVPIVHISQGSRFFVTFMVDTSIEEDDLGILKRRLPIGDADTFEGLCKVKSAAVTLETYLKEVYKPWLAGVAGKASRIAACANTAAENL